MEKLKAVLRSSALSLATNGSGLLLQFFLRLASSLSSLSMGESSKCLFPLPSSAPCCVVAVPTVTATVSTGRKSACTALMCRIIFRHHVYAEKEQAL